MYVALYVIITVVFVMMLDTLQYIIMIILQLLIVIYVTRHEKIGLMYTQNFTTFLDFEIS